MKINKKKFIYLISPNKIPSSFYNNLKLVLNTGKVSFFQLRLKKYSQNKKIIIGEKIKNICKKNKVKFIINDDPLLALKLNADGCHLGQKDMDIKLAKQILGKKIIGVTCHNSINLAKKAVKAKADYIAFGAFNQSKTKKTRHVASVKILNKVKKFTKTPTVAIGGINAVNYKNLLLNNANFLAISSYVWKNKKYKPLQAIERLK
ncbi:thiamine phosphate synthase [Candidatus Pelagibacter communis]|uniref:thiamine phosphate synthase n=1 Tax=Pelagibacter ubique TaxID=198252 RepID=UPI0009E471FC|nr:thiamine phosphate synthase [Candidatus Pelagibacter ubique]